MKRHKCDCVLCKRHRKYKRIVKWGSRKSLIAFLDEVYEELANTSEDLEYHKCILAGTWPSSCAQILNGLVRVRELRKLA